VVIYLVTMRESPSSTPPGDLGSVSEFLSPSKVFLLIMVFVFDFRACPAT